MERFQPQELDSKDYEKIERFAKIVRIAIITILAVGVIALSAFIFSQFVKLFLM